MDLVDYLWLYPVLLLQYVIYLGEITIQMQKSMLLNACFFACLFFIYFLFKSPLPRKKITKKNNPFSLRTSSLHGDSKYSSWLYPESLRCCLFCPLRSWSSNSCTPVCRLLRLHLLVLKQNQWETSLKSNCDCQTPH